MTSAVVASFGLFVPLILAGLYLRRHRKSGIHPAKVHTAARSARKVERELSQNLYFR